MYASWMFGVTMYALGISSFLIVSTKLSSDSMSPLVAIITGSTTPFRLYCEIFFEIQDTISLS